MIVVVVMGVAGSGKSTIGPMIAKALGGDYAEGDQFHPAANIAKMTRGEPLNDEDRRPWLETMAAAIAEWTRKDRPTVLACSALRQRYREVLARGSPEVRFVYLRTTPALVAQRLAARKGHFMPASLIGSQFAALEEPDRAIILDASRPPAAIAAEAVRQLRSEDLPSPAAIEGRIEAIATEIAEGATTSARRLFTTANFPVPEIAWNPAREAIPTDGLRFLHDYWQRLRGTRAAPGAREIDPVEMRQILGYLMLVDVEEAGRRFRYALYGANLVDLAAFDWTGRTTREMVMATRMPGPIFYEACYRAVLRRGVPLLTISHGAPVLAIKTWARLILPLGEPVSRFLVGNVPVDPNPHPGNAAAYIDAVRRRLDPRPR